MKQIALSGKHGLGKFVLVDDEDFERLNKWRWFCTRYGYAARTIHSKRPNRIDKTFFMHREVNQTPDNLFTDHINRDRLDNRKENLRTVTGTQNQFNKGLQKNNKSGVMGVQWHVSKWWARVYINKKPISLGCYDKLEDAIEARKRGEELYYGLQVKI